MNFARRASSQVVSQRPHVVGAQENCGTGLAGERGKKAVGWFRATNLEALVQRTPVVTPNRCGEHPQTEKWARLDLPDRIYGQTTFASLTIPGIRRRAGGVGMCSTLTVLDPAKGQVLGCMHVLDRPSSHEDATRSNQSLQTKEGLTMATGFKILD